MARRAVPLLALVAALALAAPAAPAPAHVQVSPVERAFVGTINRVRAAHGLRPVRLDAHLERAARAHTAEMLAHGFFAHGAVARRLESFGVAGPRIGETLGWHAPSRDGVPVVVRLWLRSPEHRAVLLRPGFVRVGVATGSGRFEGYDDTLVVTADFEGR
jgi:uncharacterized protein YkwD